MNDVNQACNGGDEKTWFTSPFEDKSGEPPEVDTWKNTKRKPCQICSKHKPGWFRICRVCRYKVGIGCNEAEPCWNAHSGRCTWCVNQEMWHIRCQWYHLLDVLPGHWHYLNEEIVGLVLDFACPNLLYVWLRKSEKMPCTAFIAERIYTYNMCRMRFGTRAIPRASFQFVSLCRLSDLSHIIRPLS